ncbi:MAG: hypothetical protein EPN33_14205 [Acidobacteria bacterium]|nr:MAG: hypothetical protein EPN33_14205 [Acidobacteriota bacterium]
MPEPLSSVWLEFAAQGVMLEVAAQFCPFEAGGLLLGYWNDDGSAAVMAATRPGPRAAHRLFSFVPDYEFDDKQVALAYERSGRYWGYLGDWHTHPLGSSEPSRKDLKVARNIATSEQARSPKPLMAIVSGWRNRHTQFWLYRSGQEALVAALFKVFNGDSGGNLNDNLT